MAFGMKDRSPVQGRKIGGHAPSKAQVEKTVTQARNSARLTREGLVSVEIVPGVQITVHDKDKIKDVVNQVLRDLEGY
jgi:fructose-bisphosphate aldolase class 1